MPTRSPSLDMTATCTEPATPASTAKATTRTFTAASISPETERAGACRPSPERSCGCRYPAVASTPSMVALELNTSTSAVCTSLRRMPVRHSALLAGSRSWSPWKEG